MNSIGPFKEVVAIRFPTGVSGQYIFDASIEIVLYLENFTGTVNGEVVSYYYTGDILVGPGRVEIKGRQIEEFNRFRIYAPAENLPQYTSMVYNWTLFRYYSGGSNNPSALFNYFTDEDPDLGEIEVSASSNQAGIGWFSIPDQPRSLDGENLSLMFAGAFGCGDLSNLNMPNATIAIGMFAHASGVNWNKIDAPMLEISSGMFAGARDMWSTNGDPVFYEELTDASYMFYGCDIRELFGSIFKAETLHRAFTNSDIEFIDGCTIEDTGDINHLGGSEIFVGCGKLENVSNTVLTLDRPGDFLDGTSITTWFNNELETTNNGENIALYSRVNFSSAEITDSDFLIDLGLVNAVDCNIAGCSFNVLLQADGSTFVSGSTLDAVEGNGLGVITESTIKELLYGLAEVSFSEIESITIGRLNYIKRFIKNKVDVPNGVFTRRNDDPVRPEIEILDFENSTLINQYETGQPPLVQNWDVAVIKNIESNERAKIRSIFGLSLSFGDPEAVYGIGLMEDCVIDTAEMGHLIIQRRDIELRSCFLTNLSPNSEFSDPPVNDTSYYESDNSFLTNFDYKATFAGCDIIAGRLAIACREVVSENSVFQLVNFCLMSPETMTQELFDSMIDCRVTDSYTDENPYIFDLDVSGTEFFNWLGSSSERYIKMIELRNFKPKSWVGNISQCRLLEVITNSNLNKGSDEPIVVNFSDSTAREISGCIFYYGVRFTQFNAIGDENVRIVNNRFGDPFDENPESYGFESGFKGECEWFNNNVYGNFDPGGITCQKPTGVVTPFPGSEFLLFSGETDYSDFIIDLSYIDEPFSLPNAGVGAFAYKDEFLGILQMPKFVFGDIASPDLFNNIQFRDTAGLDIALLYDLVDSCVNASGFSGSVFNWSHFNFARPFESGGLRGGYEFPRQFWDMQRVTGIDEDGNPTIFVAHFIKVTPDNLAKCQNRILTKGDNEFLIQRLQGAGFSDIYLGAIYEVRSGRTEVINNIAYSIPPHIVVKRP